MTAGHYFTFGASRIFHSPLPLHRFYAIIHLKVGDFVYNLVALWIRLMVLVLLAVALTAVALFFGRKKFKKWEKIVSVCLAVLLVLLGGGSTLKLLILPDIKTVVGT